MSKVKHSYSKNTKKSLQGLRTWVDKEIIKNNRNKRKTRIMSNPKFHFKVDNKTGKLILCFSIPTYNPDSKDKTSKKNIQKYLKSYTLENYKKELQFSKSKSQFWKKTRTSNYGWSSRRDGSFI